MSPIIKNMPNMAVTNGLVLQLTKLVCRLRMGFVSNNNFHDFLLNLVLFAWMIFHWVTKNVRTIGLLLAVGDASFHTLLYSP